jgi:hypothetical protein
LDEKSEKAVFDFSFRVFMMNSAIFSLHNLFFKKEAKMTINP